MIVKIVFCLFTTSITYCFFLFELETDHCLSLLKIIQHVNSVYSVHIHKNIKVSQHKGKHTEKKPLSVMGISPFSINLGDKYAPQPLWTLDSFNCGNLKVLHVQVSQMVFLQQKAPLSHEWPWLTDSW